MTGVSGIGGCNPNTAGQDVKLTRRETEHRLPSLLRRHQLYCQWSWHRLREALQQVSLRYHFAGMQIR